MIIKNGVGDGVLARVFPNHHLAVKSVDESTIGYKSRVEQVAFSMGCPFAYTITTSEHNIMTLFNNDTDKLFVINSLYISTNGGDTSGNKPFYGRMYKGATAPTTGILTGETIRFGNLNFGSSRITEMRAFLWDGATGDGLSGGADGQLGLLQMFGNGLTHIDLRGSVVISPSQYVRITIQGLETGKVLVSVSGYNCEMEI